MATTLPALATANSNFTNNFGAPVGVKATAPTVTPTTNTLPKTQTAGTYKGVPITPGNDASITAQMAKIDGQQKTPTNLSAPGSTPIPSSQPTQNSSSTATPPAPTYNQNNPGLYGQLITGLANTSQAGNPIATTAGNNLNALGTQDSPDVLQARQNLLDAQRQFAKQTSNINQSGTWTSRALGEQGQANIQNSNVLNALQGTLGSALSSQGQKISAATAAGGIGNSQQSTIQSGLSSAASGAAPQFPGYTNAQFNPVTGQYATVGGGQYGSGPGAAANVQSIQQAQTGMNDIDQKSQAVASAFKQAYDFGTAAGLSNDSAMLGGLQQYWGSKAGGSQNIAAFQSAIGNLNSQAQQLGIAPVDVNSVTPAQLQSLQQAVAKQLQNNKASYQSFIDKFNSGGSSSGGNYTSSLGNSYNLPY